MMLSLVSPMALQAVHAMVGHTHVTCTDASTHMHEKDIDCDIHLYQFSSYDFTSFDAILINTSIYVDNASVLSNQHLISTTRYAHHLRGPPSERSTH
jgi:menaquinone-dependent protoporphyrinogen IX oxidase